MTSYASLVRALINATVFLSSTSICYFGVPAVQGLPRRLRRAFPTEIAREYVLTSLQAHLYQNFYGRGGASPWSPYMDRPHVSPNAPVLLKQLSRVNSGAGYLEPGWEVRRVDGATVVVSRNGLEVRVRPEECVPVLGPELSPGLTVGVRFPKESLGRLPGFYLAMGDRPLSEDAWNRIVRVYWNVTAEGAVCLMRTITLMLNDACVPFHLKVSSDIGRSLRCDAAVLYLRKEDYGQAREVLEGTYREVSPFLRHGVPALTKPLAPGVGLAEDPGGGVSFGEHRCLLLADALVRAHELGKRSIEDRYGVVSDHFQRHGIPFETPYLNPGSADIYGVLPARAPRGGDPPRQARPFDRPRGAQGFLNMAARIGHQICREAVWSDGRCNWTGAMVDAAANMNYGALDPSVYNGTSGVALFLAELYAATCDPDVRATSLGAIRQALSRADSITPTSRLGLFTGWTGIALAAARVGTLVGEEELGRRARHLVDQTITQGQVRQFDVITGAAGAIVALLAFQELSPGSSLLEFCVRLGDGLLGSADKTSGYWSWRTPDAPQDRNLLGFSHGTAGIGCALLELFHAMGDVRYRDAAELAFQYERHWFDADARNWPDLRGRRATSRRHHHLFPSSTFWCHGAPGIALSRLRAYELIHDELCKAEAVTALGTTREATARALHSRDMGFSLCHGLAGNAEALLAGERVLGTEWPDGSEVASAVAAAGIERYGASGLWPSGTVGPTPSLMLGLAGIGHFYLRLANPATPSILLVHPKSFAQNGEAAYTSCPVPEGGREAVHP